MKIPIACTLTASEAGSRVDEWRDLISLGQIEERGDTTVSVRFPRDAGLAARVGALAAAEQSCCNFFTFTIRMDHEGTELTVEAPEDAALIVSGLFGRS